MTRRRSAATGLATLALALAGCGGPGTAGTSASGEGGTEPAGELTVFAAASLYVAFEEISEQFTAQHGTEVVFSFAGSADLVAQLDAGAPADVLATADESTMAAAVTAGTIAGEPTVVAENVLTLVTPAGNPADVTGLDSSLADAALVTCAPQVPCGAATTALAELLDVTLDPVSEEGAVTDVLGKVASGQADAGLVYATDAAAAGDAVDVVAVERSEEVVNRYPVAVVAGTERPELARAWADFVAGPQAQAVLAEAGFGTP